MANVQIVNIQIARFEFGKQCLRKQCLNERLTPENKNHCGGRETEKRRRKPDCI